MNAAGIREIPRFDTRPVFHDRAGRESAWPAALSTAGSRPDGAAVFSVLQLGAVIPPLSPWEDVRRLLPGHRYRGIEDLGPLSRAPNLSLADPDPSRRADALERLLDRQLLDWIGDRENPVVLFSGGVDSGLIAARLAALGRRDTLLLNYSFGKDDPESGLAEAMARHLGLRFERILMTRSPTACLTEPGRVWPLPFADVSVAPTSELAYAVADRLSGTGSLILDGTGADDTFGMAARIAMWQWVYRTPAALRRASASIYRAAGLWTVRSRVELGCRVAAMSAHMPLHSVVLAKNCLAGFLYRDDAAEKVHGMLGDWISGWASDSVSARITAVYLAVACANRVAQKGQPILEGAGHSVRYPFLGDDVADAAAWILRPGLGVEPKALLKQCLARRVPREMVYRPKSGFVDPRRDLYHDPGFIAHLREAGGIGSPIAPFLDQARVREACELLSRKKALPAYTLYCLWAIAFLDRWYRTAR